MLTSVLDAYFTYLTKQIVDTGITLKDKPALMRIALTYGVFQLMQSGFVFTFIYLAGVLGERVQYDLRKKLFNHLQELSLSYYAQNAVGRLIARVTSDTGRVSELLTWGVVDTTWAIMNITRQSRIMSSRNAIINSAFRKILGDTAFHGARIQRSLARSTRASRACVWSRHCCVRMKTPKSSRI
jgi:ATP-binding cassette subfamily B protein